MTTTPHTRVAYVTAAFPFPLSSGYLRHHHLIGELARDHDVHLLALVGPSFRPEHVDALADRTTRVQTFAHPTGSSGRLDRMQRLLDPARPGAAARELAEAVDRAIAAHDVDVLVLSGKETAVVADVAAGRVPLVVDLCDAASARITQELVQTEGARRLGLRLRRRNLRRVERHLVEQGDALLVASARDREALEEEGAGDGARRAVVVPNGVDLDHWIRGNDSLGDDIVFCGNLGYRPNADAARHLVQDLMPRVWARHPDAEVVVVGVGASPALVADLRHSLVTLTGPVPDVRPYLERAAVFAAPLRIATGIQNKLLEAMAMELPVVTTTVAAAGLGAGPPIDVADDPAVAAAAIAAALDAVQQGRRAPRADAREWVAGRFRWDRSGSALRSTIRHECEVSASC